MRQRMEPTGTNRSIGLIARTPQGVRTLLLAERSPAWASRCERNRAKTLFILLVHEA